ncbi:hypothetical protein ERJ75_001493800 [Trypanosoma vivax]|nr:hypothetical protein ERJ75_001493800 [Trypanosoma vivax]
MSCDTVLPVRGCRPARSGIGNRQAVLHAPVGYALPLVATRRNGSTTRGVSYARSTTMARVLPARCPRSLQTSVFLWQYADAIVRLTLAENLGVTVALSGTFFSRTPTSTPTPSPTRIDTPPPRGVLPCPTCWLPPILSAAHSADARRVSCKRQNETVFLMKLPLQGNPLCLGETPRVPLGSAHQRTRRALNVPADKQQAPPRI